MSEIIYAYGEFFDRKLHPGSLEILTPLRDIASALNKKVALLILSSSLEEVKNCEDIERADCDEVHLVVHESLHHVRDDLYGRVLAQIIRQKNPFGVFFPATHQGSSLAPRVAGELQVGLCAHVNGFTLKEGNLYMLRPTYGDNIIAELYSKSRPIMATLSLGAFSIREGKRAPRVVMIDLPKDFNWESKIRVRRAIKVKREPNRLSIAKVVVAGGLGLKTKENFQKLFELASLLEGEVGATRPVCHAGWVDEGRMIGVSGVSVRPKLYIGFGISGSIQHTVGIENSEFIVAVNIDKEAPLVKIANVALIADAGKVLDTLIKKLSRSSQSEL